MAELREWETFFVIVGSSAGALIGLQFILITLIAERPNLRVADAGAAFSTPTIAHFGATLFLSGLLSAPWHGLDGAALAWGTTGLLGIGYSFFVLKRMLRQKIYAPVLEDWMFHFLIPLSAYGLILGSAVFPRETGHVSLFVLGAGMMALLLVGIHNAWDAVTYHVFVSRQEPTDTRS